MKQHIKTLYPRDRAVFTALSRVGYVDDGQLHQFLRDKRIDGYLKDGLLEKDRLSHPGYKDRVCYKLTDRGRDVCRRACGVEHIYHAQSPVHDLRLAEQYFSLTPDEQQGWRCEAEIQEMMRSRIAEIEKEDYGRAVSLRCDWSDGKLSPPDAIYCSNGVPVAFEVVTKNYGTEEIEAKQDAAALLGVECEEARV